MQQGAPSSGLVVCFNLLFVFKIIALLNMIKIAKKKKNHLKRTVQHLAVYSGLHKPCHNEVWNIFIISLKERPAFVKSIPFLLPGMPTFLCGFFHLAFKVHPQWSMSVHQFLLRAEYYSILLFTDWVVSFFCLCFFLLLFSFSLFWLYYCCNCSELVNILVEVLREGRFRFIFLRF